MGVTHSAPAMKKFLAISAVLAAALGLISCEKHSWDKETKRLYPSHEHGEHKAGEHSEHKSGEHSEHKDAGHGEHEGNH